MGPQVLWAHYWGHCALFLATRLPSIRSLSLPWSPAPSIVDPDGLQSAPSLCTPQGFLLLFWLFHHWP